MNTVATAGWPANPVYDFVPEWLTMAPPVSGILGFHNGGLWLKFWPADNMSAELASIFRGEIPGFQGFGYSGFSFELVVPEFRAQRLAELNLAYGLLRTP